MSKTTKVLWGEGLFLRPQHFQLQDQFHENALNEVARTLHPYYWGVRCVKFDTVALANGQLRVEELSLIFPDGGIYDAPGTDVPPAALNLATMPDNAESCTIYLAISPLKEYGENSVDGDAQNGQVVRYIRRHAERPDLFTQAIPAEVTTLEHWVRLLPDAESREQFVTLPIARIRRSGTGGYQLDTDFIPPSSSIKASAALQLMTRQVLDILQAKVDALYGHHREPSKNVIEFRSGDIASFWLLHTASQYYASLFHLFQNPRLHPERLFQEMLSLAGALMTFSKSYSLSDLPSYVHEQPTPSFFKIDRIIRDLLETVISTRYFAIALTEVKPSFWNGRLESDKINDSTVFYLAVSSTLPAAELVDAIPLRIKVGAPDDVEKFVLSAMPGVRLTYAPQVPAAVPVRPGHYYFALENKGALYERMLKSQALGIYAPSNFPDLKLELIAVAS